MRVRVLCAGDAVLAGRAADRRRRSAPPHVSACGSIRPKAPIVIDVHRDWAPHGADRFYELVTSRLLRRHALLPGRQRAVGAVRDQRRSAGVGAMAHDDDSRRSARSSRTSAAGWRSRSRIRTGGRRRCTSACATTRRRTRRDLRRSAKSSKAWTSPTRSTASTARIRRRHSRRQAAAAVRRRQRVSRSRVSATRSAHSREDRAMNLQDLRTMLDYHYWARDRLLDALDPLDAGAVHARSRQQLQVRFATPSRTPTRPSGRGTRDGRGSRRRRCCRRISFPTSRRSGARGPRTKRRCARSSTDLGEDGVDRVFDYKLLSGQPRLVAALADAAARRQSRQLSPRAGDDDAAADRRDTGEADGYDRVLSGIRARCQTTLILSLSKDELDGSWFDRLTTSVSFVGCG